MSMTGSTLIYYLFIISVLKLLDINHVEENFSALCVLLISMTHTKLNYSISKRWERWGFRLYLCALVCLKMSIRACVNNTTQRWKCTACPIHFPLDRILEVCVCQGFSHGAHQRAVVLITSPHSNVSKTPSLLLIGPQCPF